MRGMFGIGRPVALWDVPRPPVPGSTPCRLSLPGFSGRRFWRSEGPRGKAARHGGSRGVGRFEIGVSQALASAWGRMFPRRVSAARPAPRRCRRVGGVAWRGGVQPFPPGASGGGVVCRRPQAPGAAFSRAGFGALPSALVGVQPTTVSGTRPSGPGKAAASSRNALRYGALAASLAQREPRSGPVTTRPQEVDDRCKMLIYNAKLRVRLVINANMVRC